MRGFLQPAVRAKLTDAQAAFSTLSRHRRSKLSKGAHITLVKADQWARGDAVAPEVANALERAFSAQAPKKK